MAASTSTQVNTAAYFTSKNPKLDLGEKGIESDTNKFKIGDGVTLWKALPYGGGVVYAVTGSKSTGAATASLIAALIAAGVPLSDATS